MEIAQAAIKLVAYCALNPVYSLAEWRALWLWPGAMLSGEERNNT
jgi:hypothetical protein